MNTFPLEIHVRNRKKFSKILKEHIIKYLRQQLYDHILKGNQQEQFSLLEFNDKYLGDKNILVEIVTLLLEELHELGWKTKILGCYDWLLIYDDDGGPLTYGNEF